jgi:GH15 family glucan-1,4-alpha-glucosidase
MAARIEDYALLGDTGTAALVSRGGSIDWLCLPRFDSPACFAALLGDERQGRWLLAPSTTDRARRRAYRGETFVLETEYETADGAVTVTDAMAPREPGRGVNLARIVAGVTGRVSMTSELAIRFGLGRLPPWVDTHEGTLVARSGPDALRLWTPVELDVRERGALVRAEFTVAAGERVPFLLTWYPSHEQPPPLLEPETLVDETERFWRDWAGRCTYDGEWREAVVRSLLTLIALTYRPTGGLVAAATTSLPEVLGGSGNWDYRYSWLRDATFAISAMHDAGYVDEAFTWRDWLIRTVAGDPEHMQIVYGAGSERNLVEWEVEWLPGYEGSAPVRVGNAAARQFQLDVYGELVDSQCRLVLEHGFAPGGARLVRHTVDLLESVWSKPDQGIWEARDERKQFTYSKVMAWVAFDRAVELAEHAGLEGPVARWRALRDQIHGEVCAQGFDRTRNAFVQSYGADELDAALLRIPVVRFLPAEDPRVAGTVDAVRRELTVGEGLVRRNKDTVGDGAFIACCFWLVDALTMLGRKSEARELFERLLALRNEVGLLSEEYDTEAGRFTGNFPQALSHLGLVNSALRLGDY